MKSGQTTIKDIAKALNISPSTVSRALKDHPDISQETKRNVVELADRLNYEPNTIALSLRNSKTNTIGIIIPKIVHHFFSTVISGIEDIAHEQGYNVIIAQSNESYSREVESVKAMVSSRVDALFISISRETQDYAHFRMLERKNIPLLFFDRICPDLDTNRIVVEDYQGAFEAVKHLIQEGCRDILHLAGPPRLIISEERKRGYLDALRANGLPIREELIMTADNQELGYQTTQGLLRDGRHIDGIFANNDPTAIGAMMAIKEIGLSIPQDIAVIGFEDAPIAQVIEPHLSSVRQPGFEMGQAAAQLFLDHSLRLAKSENVTPETKIFKTTLLQRASTQKLRRSL